MANIVQKAFVTSDGSKVNFFTSTAVEMSVHNPTDKTLSIKMNSGEWYCYLNVPKGIATGFIDADSQGKAFLELIRDKYQFKKNPSVV